LKIPGVAPNYPLGIESGRLDRLADARGNAQGNNGSGGSENGHSRDHADISGDRPVSESIAGFLTKRLAVKKRVDCGRHDCWRQLKPERSTGSPFFSR
jgi:hypothetical protein